MSAKETPEKATEPTAKDPALVDAIATRDAAKARAAAVQAERDAIAAELATLKAAQEEAAAKAMEEQGQWKKRFEMENEAWKKKHGTLESELTAERIGNTILSAASKSTNPGLVGRLMSPLFTLGPDHKPKVDAAALEAFATQTGKAITATKEDGTPKSVREIVEEFIALSPEFQPATAQSGGGTASVAAGTAPSTLMAQVAAMTPDAQREWRQANPAAARKLFEQMKG